ncbi:MAG: class I SAM-dependent methyltransferase [Acidimicrobiales bacterium]
MTVDHYARSGRGWATGATIVYGPIAAELVGRSPHPLAGRTVLDAGAGTGAASVALATQGAQTMAVDFSPEMLAWDKAARPPAAVADVCALPLADHAVDDCVAAFVLNHLTDPGAGFAEIVRVTRPGGAVLVAVFSNASRSAARDRIDVIAQQAGWKVPDWYLEIKATAVPLLGTPADLRAAGCAAGLHDVQVDEKAVDVGVTTPEQLVDYRFGQAHYASWLDEIGEERAALLRQAAVDEIRPIMTAYTPIVVFLTAVAPPP